MAGGRFLEWLQNGRTENVFQLPNVPVLQEIGVAGSNGVVRIAGGNLEMSVSAHAQQNMAKNLLKSYQIAKISVPLKGVDVAENDGDNRFRTGSRNSGVSAYAQRKMAKSAMNAF